MSSVDCRHGRPQVRKSPRLLSLLPEALFMIASATCPNGHPLADVATVADGTPSPQDLTTCPVCGVALEGDRTLLHTAPAADDAPRPIADPTFGGRATTL